MAPRALRPLCLSWWVPPAVNPQAILIGKMIPEWIAQGAEPIVVTLAGAGDWRPGAPVVRVPAHAATAPAPKNLMARWSTLLARRLAATRALRNAIRDHVPDVVYSFSAPQETNVLGAAVRRRTGLPFVSHFSDPWFDNPYNPPSGWRSWRVRRAEARVVAASDRIVFTNDAAAALVMGKYGERDRAKAVVIPHCFDPRDYPAGAPDTGTFVLSYVGTFYKERNPDALFTALGRVFRVAPDLRSRLRVHLVGPESQVGSFSSRHLDQMIGQHELRDVVRVLPQVDYRASLAVMRSSSCLVVIDADFERSPFLPSKVVDYAGSRRPIVGITPADSPTAQFLQRLEYRAFGHSDLDGLAAYLRELIVSGTASAPNEAVLREYEVSSTTARLLSVFREVVEEAAAGRR